MARIKKVGEGAYRVCWNDKNGNRIFFKGEFPKRKCALNWCRNNRAGSGVTCVVHPDGFEEPYEHDVVAAVA